ncbi:N-acetyltransferase [Anaerosporobacter faecicola]|uniref:N-acetyltransferase n=1 Tax=Anaerosporobacter faecicola TaxID=2718714 RepID=UPI0014390C6C|nr:N-acetyltransferase [Anaerosporobacter faecicola]
MEYIKITEENLEEEHICCAITKNTDCQVQSKKTWLRERMKEGLVFLKADARGKCFIQYAPAEHAWTPIEANGYMFIDCLWVSGQFVGHGYAGELLQQCIQDAKEKGRKGLCILSADKKRPFLADPKFLTHLGFECVDHADPFYTLYTYYFEKKQEGEIPRFKENVRHPQIKEKGYVLYYSSACPFTARYVPLLAEYAKEQNIPFQAIQFKNTKQAQEAPAPFTTFSLFCDGKFLTHEILSLPKFKKIVGKE